MARSGSFSAIDEQAFKAFHWRVLLTTGMGVFCDGYDLSSIGIVLPLVLTWFGVHTLTGLQSGLLVASALLGSAVGAMIFGLLAQNGRKRFYGIDVMIMGIAAVALLGALLTQLLVPETTNVSLEALSDEDDGRRLPFGQAASA